MAQKIESASKLVWKNIGMQPSELQEYSARGAELWGSVTYPVSYLMGSQTYGYYYGQRMIAGFALVSRAPLRTLSFLSPEMRCGSSVFRRASDSDFIELAGIWYSSKETSVRDLALNFWKHLGDVISQLPQKYVIYGYNLERTGLQRVYSRFRPIVLYRGPKLASAMPTGNTQSIVSIEAVPVSRFSEVIPMILAQLGAQLREDTGTYNATSSDQPVSPSEGVLQSKLLSV